MALDAGRRVPHTPITMTDETCPILTAATRLRAKLIGFALTHRGRHMTVTPSCVRRQIMRDMGITGQE